MPATTKASRRKKYYGGKGDSVLALMKKRYGKKKGEEIFYATINKNITKGTKKQKAAQPKTRPGQKRRKRS